MTLTRRELLAGSLTVAAAAAPPPSETIFIVANFHPASCGWLTNFSKERVYCANSYFDHLDRVRDDPQYAFVLSECNNLVAMMNFQPGRVDELKQRIREGRVELVNGFFLESTINLSGGEALVRLGVEGLRWQQEVFGVRPRLAWTIDVCGTHDQMAQITAGLGLDAMVYTRKNPTGSALHWAESPDGTRVLALSPGHYSELRALWTAKGPLPAKETEEIRKAFADKTKVTPAGAPRLILAGSGDYSLAPDRKDNPGAFLKEWKAVEPGTEVRFATASQYLDAVLPGIRSGKIQIPTLRGGTAYDFDAFWIQCPRVKSWYRRCEHALQAAEMLATGASLSGKYPYPARELYHAWLQMFLNMDRNTLWGAAGGMVFEHERSWDARDRFRSVEAIAAGVHQSAGSAATAPGEGIGLFNPLSWTRDDPFVVRLPAGRSIDGASMQALPNGEALCRMSLPAASAGGWKLAAAAPIAGTAAALPEIIATKHYSARIDPKSGALVSLKLAQSGREVLGGPANVVVAERPNTQRYEPGNHIAARPGRSAFDSSAQHAVSISVTKGPLATIVTIEGTLAGAPLRRTIRFYESHPRIDFETELNDLPDRTVAVAEFPLAAPVAEIRRGIPYGFSHGSWDKPNPDLHGWTKGITPAVRWSHYAFEAGGGVALLDRGLTGREINGKTPIIYLYNAADKYYGYPNSWLSGKGKHLVEYALAAHEGDWKQARIPQLAWEFNCPPIAIAGRGPAPGRPMLETSPNVIVESLRRDAGEIELRLVECLGYAGTAEVSLALPHKGAALADLAGGHRKPLSGGPRYSFPVRSQQIVTLRFQAPASVEDPAPLLQWDELVPEPKRAALREYSLEKGHPPRGD